MREEQKVSRRSVANDALPPELASVITAATTVAITEGVRSVKKMIAEKKKEKAERPKIILTDRE